MCYVITEVEFNSEKREGKGGTERQPSKTSNSPMNEENKFSGGWRKLRRNRGMEHTLWCKLTQILLNYNTSYKPRPFTQLEASFRSSYLVTPDLYISRRPATIPGISSTAVYVMVGLSPSIGVSVSRVVGGVCSI